MAKVLVPLAKGFEEIEAVSIIDVLRRGGVEVVTASISDDLHVVGAHNMEIKADVLLSAVENELFDAVSLPGGGEGTENLKKCEKLLALLHRHSDEGNLVTAICAAPTVLELAGVVPPEVQMTCYPTCQMELNRPWVGAPVVHDDNFITGQAPGSALLFALVLLRALYGDRVAQKVARGMVTDILQ